MNEKQICNTQTNDNHWITGSWLGTSTYMFFKEARGCKIFRKKLNIYFLLQILLIILSNCYFIIWYKNHSKKSFCVGPRWHLKCKYHWKSSKLSPFDAKMPFFGIKIEIFFLNHRWTIFLLFFFRISCS